MRSRKVVAENAFCSERTLYYCSLSAQRCHTKVKMAGKNSLQKSLNCKMSATLYLVTRSRISAQKDTGEAWIRHLLFLLFMDVFPLFEIVESRVAVLATWHIRSKNGSFAVATVSVLISLLLKSHNSNRGRIQVQFPL